MSTVADHYWERGYVNRLPVLSPAEAQALFDRLEALEAEELERRGGTWDQRDYRPWEAEDHPFRLLAEEIVHHDAILDAVEEILGPDLLVRNADFFVKEPKVRRGIGWHLDTAERGPDADLLLTAWIGLTASTRDNGCLKFVAGSHRQQLPHGPEDKYHLTLKREAVAHLDPSAVVYNEMDQGMMSMHHFRTVHGSDPNRTRERRAGFVVRFMAPAISSDTAESGIATLVRGKDTHGHFTLRDRFPMTWAR